MSSLIEKALALIEEAFGDVPRPTNEELLHPDSMDTSDLEPLYAIAHWRDMTDEDVVGTYAAPSFLSAAGFRHFLPAYMCHALRNPDSSAAYVSGTIWHLDPSLYAPTIAEYARSKFVLFDDAQRQAVVAFLQAMLGSGYREDARKALQEWYS